MFHWFRWNNPFRVLFCPFALVRCQLWQIWHYQRCRCIFNVWSQLLILDVRTFDLFVPFLLLIFCSVGYQLQLWFADPVHTAETQLLWSLGSIHESESDEGTREFWIACFWIVFLLRFINRQRTSVLTMHFMRPQSLWICLPRSLCKQWHLRTSSSPVDSPGKVVARWSTCEARWAWDELEHCDLVNLVKLVRLRFRPKTSKEATEHCVQPLAADKKICETSVQVMQDVQFSRCPLFFSKRNGRNCVKAIGVFSAGAFAGKIKQSHPAFEPSNTEWAISASA